jgi:hypothetical protein
MSANSPEQPLHIPNFDDFFDEVKEHESRDRRVRQRLKQLDPEEVRPEDLMKELD